MSVSNPKLCECGCGRPAPIARQTHREYGHVKGQPVRFIVGHGRATHRKSFRPDGRLTPTYSTWMSMRRRCHSPSAHGFAEYGAKGIAVCDRWRNSFENFIADMGERPAGTTIDRIDNDRGYEPANCRWATPRQQALNQRKTSRLTVFGRTQSVTQWADEVGIPSGVIWGRLRKGMPPELALTKPTTINVPIITAFGKTQTAKKWSAETGIKYSTIYYRLNHGWSPEDCVTP